MMRDAAVDVWAWAGDQQDIVDPEEKGTDYAVWCTRRWVMFLMCAVLAVLFAAAVVVVMVVARLGRMRLRLRDGVLGGREVGSCSKATAAACLALLGWGFVVDGDLGKAVAGLHGDSDDDRIGNCALSNDKVGRPVPGRLFA